MFALRSIPADPAVLANGSGGSGDDFLTCRMCLIPFSHLNRLPLALNCLHTFCEHCVSAWAQNKTKNHKLTCPLCKKITKMERGVKPKDALPVNRAVLELAAVTGTSPFYPTPQRNCMPSVVMPVAQYMLNNQLLNAGGVEQNSFVPVLKDSTNTCSNDRLGPFILVNSSGIQGFPISEEKMAIPNEYPNLVSMSNVSVDEQGWIDSPKYAPQNRKVIGVQDNWDQIQNSFQQQQLQQQLQQQQQQLQQQQKQRQQQQQQQSQTYSFLDEPKSEQCSHQQPSFPKDQSYKKFGRPTPFTASSSHAVVETVVKMNPPAPVKIEERNCSTKEFVSNVSIGDVRVQRSAQTTGSSAHAPSPVACHEPAPQSTAINQHQPLTFQVGSLARHGGITAMQQPMMKSRGEPEECTTGVNLLAGNSITALNVNSSPAISAFNVSLSFNGGINKQNSEATIASTEPSRSDLCTSCFKYPAKVSVASSKAMKAQRLCTSCHTEKKTDLASIGVGDCAATSGATQLLNQDKNSSVSKPKVDANSATNIRKKTVIKVHDEKATSLVDRFQRDADFNDGSAEWLQNTDSNTVPDALLVSTSMMKLDGPVRINANSRDIFLPQPKGSESCRTSNERISPIQTQPSISDISVPSKNIQEPLPVHATSTRIDLGEPSGRNANDRQKYGVVGVRQRSEIISSGVGCRKTETRQAAASFPHEYVVNPSGPQPKKLHSGLILNRDTKTISNTIANAPELESEYETRRPEAYNPQYVETNVEWSSPQVVETAPQPDVHMIVTQTTKHQEAMSYEGGATTLPPSVGGGWNITNSSGEKSGPYPPEVIGNSYQAGGMYTTLRAPPRYEEVMGTAATLGGGQANIAPVGGVGYPANNVGNARAIGRFGKYGEVSTQPGVLRAPARLSFTPQFKASESMSTNTTGDKIVVVDQANMTVQVFSGSTGECISLIRVPGAGGACLLADGNLVVSTSRGIDVYNTNGVLVKNIAMNSVINVVRYRAGFIAIQPRALMIFRDISSSMGTVRTLTNISKPGQFRHPTPFQDISDVAINSQQDLVVLDGGVIYTLTDDGFIKSTTSPAQDSCSALKQPTAVTVDRSHNVIVSDTGNQRVLMFGANGKYQRTLYDGGVTGSHSGQAGRPTWPIGLDVNDKDQLFVVVKGDKYAEVVVLVYI